jgi:putative DNA-binding protein
MAVKYNVIERKNLLKPTEAPKFYASAKADGEVSFKALAKEIAGAGSTVSDTDVLAVLNDLTKALVKYLAEGKIVRFGDFGSFQVSVSSNGAETAEKFTASNITGNKIQFRPGVDLKAMLATVKYEKMKTK